MKSRRQDLEAQFLDRCIHRDRTEAESPTGQPMVTFVDKLIYICALDLSSSHEAEQGDERVVTSGRVMLPMSALGVITAEDRIRVTHRYQQELLVPMEFDLIGDPLPSPDILSADIRAVRL